MPSSRHFPMCTFLVLILMLGSSFNYVSADEMESELPGPRSTSFEEPQELAEEITSIRTSDDEGDSWFSRFKRFVKSLFGIEDPPEVEKDPDIVDRTQKWLNRSLLEDYRDTGDKKDQREDRRDRRDEEKDKSDKNNKPDKKKEPRKDPKKDDGNNRDNGDNRSTEEYVRSLYREILQRKPDQGGLKHWIEQINSGKVTREKARKLFYESDEYCRRFGHKKGHDENKDNDGKKEEKQDVGEGFSEPKRFDFGPRESGIIEFETCGINHQDKPCINGDWEYIFATMRGENMKRFLLLPAGGGGRAIRNVLQGGGTDTMRMEVASDNLPTWHRWTIKWGGGTMQVFLDGKQIGPTEKFNGRPSTILVGGNENGRRNFLGKWRNFSIK